MTSMHRRTFFRHAGRMVGGTLASFSALQALAVSRPSRSSSRRRAYGPLRDAGQDLALPAGFQYRVLGIQGEVMSDGHKTPAMHDGMCALPLPSGHVRLIRNHEVRQPASWPGAVPFVPDRGYDPEGGGGTTSLEVDPVSRELVRSFVSLCGTTTNCAGGPTPWGSWMSCEESTAGKAAGMEAEHGYVFEVPARAAGPVKARPIRALGRFVHEALAVDPDTGTIYLTEDQPDCGFYRFVPDVPSEGDLEPALEEGGQLQMLMVEGLRDLSQGQTVGKALRAAWVNIDDPDPPDAESHPGRVFEQGAAQGGARFRRCEGCWYGEGSVFFTSTTGGDAFLGQVWRYRPTGTDGGELTLICESRNREQLKMPDNLCVTPRGGLVLCEDSDGVEHLRGLTQEGELFDLARNIGSSEEFCGATFSPDGKTLFVNVQGNGITVPGKTFAIWGPWDEGPL